MLYLHVASHPIWISQNTLERFARRAAREILHDNDCLDALIFGVHALVDPIAQHFGGDVSRLTQNDRCQWCLSPLFAANAKHGRLLDGGMPHDDKLAH